MSASNENIRIAKNTVIVYIRLIVTAVIGLITSRFVLQILGASDFGLYSVIGGVIAMFTFISGSLQATTVRFINYEMGRKEGNLSHIFNTAFLIHLSFSVIILIIAELVGLFYIQYYLNIDSSKLDDAFFVFQVSVIAACMGIVNVPFQGLLVANEKFFHIACVDILSVVCKLFMVLALLYHEGNVLRLYAFGMSMLTVMSFVIYFFLCRKYWPSVVRCKMVKDAKQYKEMLIFNNYTLLTTASLMARNQGSNLLINYFFGTVVNAAYAISNTVHVYVNTFAGCFDQASSPQITQSLSRGDNDRAVYLVHHTCRICILLVEIVYFMMVADLDYVLHLWLGNHIPEGTEAFCQLTLLLAVVSATSGGLAQYINGLGRLKWFTIVMSVLYLVALIFGIVLYRAGYSGCSIIVLFIVADIINRGVQLLLLKRMTDFPVIQFLREAYLRPIMVFLIGCAVMKVYHYELPLFFEWRLVGIVAVGVILSLFVFWIGLYRVERRKIISHISNKLRIKSNS